jgi:hypothetical protein
MRVYGMLQSRAQFKERIRSIRRYLVPDKQPLSLLSADEISDLAVTGRLIEGTPLVIDDLCEKTVGKYHTVQISFHVPGDKSEAVNHLTGEVYASEPTQFTYTFNSKVSFDENLQGLREFYTKRAPANVFGPSGQCSQATPVDCAAWKKGVGAFR